jgi:hypothetical protein
VSNFIVYVPEKGLSKANGEMLLSFESLDSDWKIESDSLDSADVGDLFCQIENKQTFYHVVRELWRCLKKDAVASMDIPHPKHDLFLSNPEYTRAILPETLEKFNAELNDKWKALGLPHPKLAHKLGVHFEITALQMNADPYWQDLLQKQQIGSEDLNLAAKQAMNVVTTMQIKWAARKTGATKKSESYISDEVIAQFKTQIEQHKKNGNHQAASMIEDMIRQAQEKTNK